MARSRTRRAFRPVYVSLGSNIAPEQNLQLACRALRGCYGALELSAVYRSRAVGFDGDDFLNMVVGFETPESPERIRDRLEALHRLAGRKRLPNPYSPRSLDADMLLVGDQVSRQPRLPHGDIDKYSFVLRPLAELAPDLPHPVHGDTFGELWERFDQAGCPLQKVDLDLN